MSVTPAPFTDQGNIYNANYTGTDISRSNPRRPIVNYSSPVINQNAPVTNTVQVANKSTYQSQWIYQTFHLPEDYQVGTTQEEIKFPDLSGVQVQVNIQEGFASSATIDYKLDQYVPSSGWTSLIVGKQIGAATTGQTWVDILFDAPQPITASVVQSLFRVGVRVQSAVKPIFNATVEIVGNNYYRYQDQLLYAELAEGIPYPLSVTFGGDYGFLLLNQGSVTYSTQHGVNSLCCVSPAPFGPSSYAYYAPYDYYTTYGAYPNGYPYNYPYGYGYPYYNYSFNAVNGYPYYNYSYAGYPYYNPYYGYLYYNEIPLAVAIAAEQAATALSAQAELALLQSATQVSINFRILALVADSGTDFLGNKYRSYVDLTSRDYWMSSAQPSAFAVVSQYFDVRPVAETSTLGPVNLMTNPSFEYDANGSHSPFGWNAYDYLTTRDNLQVTTSWAASGAQSLRSTSTFTANGSSPAPFSGVITPGSGTSGMPVQVGSTYSAEVQVNVLSFPTGPAPGQIGLPLLFTGALGITLSITWYNATGGVINVTNSPLTTAKGIQTLAINAAVAPATAAFASLAVTYAGNLSGTLDFYVDAAQFTLTGNNLSYFDGDTPGGYQWLGQRGRSMSATLLTINPNNTVVIDGVLVDPITPNMAFNVYYSLDDTGNNGSMTERDWEQKLWTRVPQVYVATQSQEYVFPDPVVAKYMKLEFTNLPAQTYSPGVFVQPTNYKKFPTWVADFFVQQLELPSFVASLVNVQNDALNFAYNYYLDDLNQTPATPVAAPSNQIANLNHYFNQNNVANLVDAATLQEINLVLSSFEVPTGSIVNNQSLLGQAAQSVVNTVAPLTSESPTNTSIDYGVVSSLQREPVIFDQSLPVMFFFVACRHTYKELTASFDYNRAYFAGTNQVVFLRSDYTTVTDDHLYIESGGDMQNAVINDFFIDPNGDWYCYDPH